jgi:diadenosine tetraphosphatase ApaH/serine/threonine PP2A family protein phosphatase
MRLAILSDVHANLEALLEVEAEVGRLGVDAVCCLGDVVGYGASPGPVCDRIRALGGPALLGNHDAAAAGRMDYAYYYEAARRALDWTAGQLSPEQLGWIRGLPYDATFGGVGLCHGSPLDPPEYEYLLAVEQARALLPAWPRLPPVTFVGHSHLCRAFALARDGRVEDVSARRLELDPELKYVLSVGSVGQPRDYDNRACFVTYDGGRGLVEYHRVAYDIAASAGRILAAPLARNFAKRLFLGV